MSDYASQIAEALRVELARKNRSRSELAAHLNLSQTALHRRFSGAVSWRADELRRAAEYLGVPISVLVPEPTKAAS